MANTGLFSECYNFPRMTIRCLEEYERSFLNKEQHPYCQTWLWNFYVLEKANTNASNYREGRLYANSLKLR